MAKNKQERFREIAVFENVLELTDFPGEADRKPKGKWGSDIFGSDHPLTLELACGKGHYTLALAGRNPQKNFVGIDIKGARLWKGAKEALKKDLQNVRFLRIYIDHLDEYFAAEEVGELWITFPDPYPRAGDRNKRLCSAKFLSIYQKVVKPGAPVHFKTDNDALFKSTKKTILRFGCEVHEIVEDIYRERPGDELLTIKTDYEKRHLKAGKSISYLKFSLPV